MAYSTAFEPVRLQASLAPLTGFMNLLGLAFRYNSLFEMSDAQLAARGLSRGGLGQSFLKDVNGL